MSIIERALLKHRKAADQTQRQLRPSIRPPREPGVTVAAPARERRSPSESLHIELEALRTAGMVPPEEFNEQLTEQLRRIKWPLLEAAALGRGTAGATPSNLVAITSSIANEGKTFVSFNLALSIARERDLDVLLVDADIAKRHLTRVLGADARPGLTDAAGNATLDPEDLVLGTGISGFNFLPSGHPTSLASELFASRRMAEVLAALRATDPQRIVVFDCSPLLATNETQVLASLVDQIVLVVGAESTPQPVVLEALSHLDGSKQIRCLLNQTRLSRLNEYYYYGYGYPANEPPKLP